MIKKVLLSFSLCLIQIFCFSQIGEETITVTFSDDEGIGEPPECKHFTDIIVITDLLSTFNIAGTNTNVILRVSARNSLNNNLVQIRNLNGGPPSNSLDFQQTLPSSQTSIPFYLSFYLSPTIQQQFTEVKIKVELYDLGSPAMADLASRTYVGNKAYLQCVFGNEPIYNGKIGNSDFINLHFDHYSNTVLFSNKNQENQIVKLDLYTINGQLVQSIWKDFFLSKGENKNKIKLPDLPSGFYFLRYKSDSEMKVTKILIPEN